MFDVRNRTAPSNIQALFQDISNVHSYNTRSSASNDFSSNPCRLSVQANCFSRTGVKVWNEIPQALKNLSKNAFKKGLQDSYIDLSEIYLRLKVLICPLPNNINNSCS